MTAAPPRRREPDFRSLEQAADWFALLRSGDATARDEAGWRQWLERSTAHRTAWAYVESVSQRFAQLQDNAGADAAANALAAGREHRRSRRQALKTLAGLGALAPLGWMAWSHTPLGTAARSRFADHRTAVGETRSVTLADGTRVWLDSASAIAVRYDDGRRQVDLVAGAVLVETAPDRADRPFVVASDHGRLRPLGTHFSVRRHADDTEAAVYEGAVALQPGGIATPTVLKAGEGARFDAGGITTRFAVTDDHAAWRRGVLVADHMPLGEVVAAIGRYRHGYLGVDPEVATLAVMGVYRLDDPEHALAMLAEALPVRVHCPLPWWTTVVADTR